MVLNLVDDELDELVSELLRERFGRTVPVRERRKRPTPLPARVADSPRVCAERRRLLCEELDGYYRDDRPARAQAAA